MSPIILIGLGAVLFGLGVGLGILFTYSQRKREATKVSDIQNELDEYRRHVSEHFGQTAQHFQMLGQQYQSLYEHMAEGAQALCDSAQSDALSTVFPGPLGIFGVIRIGPDAQAAEFIGPGQQLPRRRER